MFIELTSLEGDTVIINVTQIAGISTSKSPLDQSECSNIWWATNENSKHFKESYDQIKEAIRNVTGQPVHGISPSDYEKGDMFG
ncbi:hypothetical protein [Spirosoma flavum]|uniref:Uncharacterized protein n=1 Tax=Spirosoma flavum TaxID=2048557 RepID=A0ABW6ALQ1_9BACT